METSNEPSSMIVRQPSVAGHFYPGTPEKIKQYIVQLELEPEILTEKVIGSITPHASYDCCGRVLAETFKRIRTADAYLLLGPNHREKKGNCSIFQRGIWKTPLGDVEIDSALTGALMAETSLLKNLPEDHENEHCLEVQLPIMQYMADRPFKIAPILIPTAYNNELCQELAMAIARTVRNWSGQIVIIATSDFSQDLSPEMAERKDGGFLQEVALLELEELTADIKRFGYTYCGINSIVTMLLAARELGATGGELVKYITHGESEDDFTRVNGYAGMLIK
jgi:AmmeMemoRadiSam system protein B